MIKKLTDDIFWVGALNPALRVFDIVMKTEYGTTYNSYLIKDEKITLIDVCHSTFFPEFIENLEAVCDVSKIDYIIVNHTEPDHSGALAKLLERAPHAEVLGTNAASMFLKKITNKAEFKFRVVKDGETLSIGKNTLRFIIAPFLHWPDTMFTYLEREKTVFTCDFLGSHYCEPRILDTAISYRDAFEGAVKNYFDAIFGPFKSYVKSGLSKLAALDFDIACVSHGPVLTKGGMLDYVIGCYAKWAEEVSVKRLSVFYASAYGYTEALAKTAAAAAEEKLEGYEINLVNLVGADMSDAHKLINESSAVMIGTPTLNSDAVPPIWELIAGIDAINARKKPVAVFGSYGWSGEAVPAVCSRLSLLRMAVYGEGLKINFKPSEKDLGDMRVFAQGFYESIAAKK